MKLKPLFRILIAYIFFTFVKSCLFIIKTQTLFIIKNKENNSDLNSVVFISDVQQSRMSLKTRELSLLEDLYHIFYFIDRDPRYITTPAISRDRWTAGL